MEYRKDHGDVGLNREVDCIREATEQRPPHAGIEILICEGSWAIRSYVVAS